MLSGGRNIDPRRPPAQYAGEVVQIKRLRHIVIHARGETGVAVALLGVGRQRDDGQPPLAFSCPTLADAAGGLEAVDLGHAAVHQHKREVILGQQSQGSLATLGNHPIATNLMGTMSVAGLLVHARDVTERNHAEEQVRALNAELERRVIERTAAFEVAIGDLEQEAADRKRAEETLEETKQRLRTVVNNTPVIL
jgi:PAS domain-containing protein